MSAQTVVPARSQQRFTLPMILVRLEGLAILGAALALYFTQDFGWVPFVVFLLAPDLSALGYLISTRVGNTSYNLVHTLVVPLMLSVAAGLTGNMLGLQIALIWLAHIGMDRAVGYGFKEGELPARIKR